MDNCSKYGSYRSQKEAIEEVQRRLSQLEDSMNKNMDLIDRLMAQESKNEKMIGRKSSGTKRTRYYKKTREEYSYYSKSNRPRYEGAKSKER